jgi:mannosyltransferase
MTILHNKRVNVTPGEKGGGNWGKLQLTRPWIWITALTILATALRAIEVNRGLWWDEIYFLVITVRRPLAEIVTIFPGDTQHPLYSILARLSILAFGEHVWSLRLPAVVFGAASIPVMYLLGVTVTTRTEAVISAALLAVSYHHVWFSQNARGYTMLAFWALSSTLFLLRGMRTGRRGPYYAYSVAASLGVYTHLTMLFLVVSHGFICAGAALMDWNRGLGLAKWRIALQAFLLTGGLTLLFYAPIATQVRNFFVNRPSSMRAVSTPRWAVSEILRGLTRGLGTEGILVIAALIIACGAWSYYQENRLVFVLFALPGAFTAIGAVLVRGTMYPRFYFFLIGFAVLILVRGLMVIPRWIAAHWLGGSARANPRLAPALSASLAAVLLASSAFSLARNYRYPKQDFEAAIQFVDAERKAGEPVVTAGASTFPLLKYYAKPWESVETAEQLREICRRGRPVWVVYTFPRYLESWSPPLAEMIRNEFTVTRRFPGTVGDGDVFVAKSQPR